MLSIRLCAALCAVGVIACSGSISKGSGQTPSDGDPSDPVLPATPPPATCETSGLMSALGKKNLLIGYADENVKTPFDLRYTYLASYLDSLAPPCQNYDWWGCWKDGSFVQEFIAEAKKNGQIPMFTYYIMWSFNGDGWVEIESAVRNTAFMAKYLADFRELLTRIGSELAFIHIEPDFWGYAGQIAIPKGQDAHQLPAVVASFSDCAGFEDSMAGLGRCMIAMVRKHAPNAKVGLHASPWGTNNDVLLNDNPSFDVAGEGRKLGNFLKSCGADLGDFVVADMSDRDAGCYENGGEHCTPKKNTWWNEGETPPSFAQAFTWSKSVADTVGRPILWWQIPVGNKNQDNSPDHWKDNRVDYLFGHLNEVTNAGGIGLVFGAGAGGCTTPSSDGDNLVNKATAYAASGGAPICQ